MLRNRKRIQSSKHALRRKRQFRFRLILVGVLGISLLAGVSYWSHHPKFTVHTVVIEGVQNVEEQKVREIVERDIQGSHLFLISRSNRLFIPRQRIKEHLYTEIEALSKVTIRAHKDVLTVTTQEFEPVALWCNSSNLTPAAIFVEGDEASEVVAEPVVQKQCYFINELGIVFIEEPPFHDYDLPIFHNVIEGDPLGKVYDSYKLFKTIQTFSETLQTELGITISEIYTDDDVTFTFRTATGADLLVDKTDDFVLVADNLATLIDKDAINKAQFNNIEYIDLRFGNRVFYKLK